MASLPQQSAFPPLVVSTNPPATERVTRPSFVLLVVFPIVIALAGMAQAALGASTGSFGVGLVSALPAALCFCFLFVLALQIAAMRGSQSIKRTALTLDEAGFHGVLPQGEISVPWTAVDRLSIRTKGKHRILTFHFTASVAPEDVGVHTTLPPRMFAALRKQGFQIGQTAIDAPLETLAAASGAFTAGRLGVPAG